MMATASADSSFNNFSISVWDACMITVTSECANAVQVRCCDFLVSLFDSLEGFACSFNMIGS